MDMTSYRYMIAFAVKHAIQVHLVVAVTAHLYVLLDADIYIKLQTECNDSKEK